MGRPSSVYVLRGKGSDGPRGGGFSGTQVVLALGSTERIALWLDRGALGEEEGEGGRWHELAQGSGARP